MKSKMDLKRVLATNPLLLRSCAVSSSASYLVLEEGLDEQAAVPDVRAQALQEVVQLLLLLGPEHVLRVEDARRLEALDLARRRLLELALREDSLHLLVEGDLRRRSQRLRS